MRYNVAALRDAVSKAQAADQAEWEGRKAAHEREQAQHTATWLANHADDWDRTALAIRRKLRRNEPITRDDLPTTCHGSTAVYSPMPGRYGEYRPDRELVALGVVLDTLTDDTVTASGLRTLGISAPVMRRCVLMLAKGSVSE